MKPFREEEFDQMFKNRLLDYQPQPTSSFWGKIKKRLPFSPRRRRLILFFLLLIGTVSAWNTYAYMELLLRSPQPIAKQTKQEIPDPNVENENSSITSLDNIPDTQFVFPLSQTQLKNTQTENVSLSIPQQSENRSNLSPSFTNLVNGAYAVVERIDLSNSNTLPIFFKIRSQSLEFPNKVELKKEQQLLKNETEDFYSHSKRLSFRFRPQVMMSYLNIRPTVDDEFYLYGFAGRRNFAFGRIGLRANLDAIYPLSEKIQIYGGVNLSYQRLRFNYLVQDPLASYIQLLADGNQQLEVVPVYKDTLIEQSDKILQVGLQIGGELLLKETSTHAHILDISLDNPLVHLTKKPTYLSKRPLYGNLGYRLNRTYADSKTVWIQPFIRFPLHQPKASGAFRVNTYQIGLGMGIKFSR